MHSKIKRQISVFSCMSFILCLLAACGSTEEIVEEPECRSPSAESCDPEKEQERGYDPCLINDKLPVCKS